MSQAERTIEYLETAEVGAYVENEDNGREVVVENMAGGRYLCLDSHKEVAKLTDSPCVAYMYLVGVPGIEEVAK